MLVVGGQTSLYTTPAGCHRRSNRRLTLRQLVSFPGAVSDFQTRAFEAARRGIRSKIVVLEDRQILAGVQGGWAR